MLQEVLQEVQCAIGGRVIVIVVQYPLDTITINWILSSTNHCSALLVGGRVIGGGYSYCSIAQFNAVRYWWEGYRQGVIGRWRQ